MSRERKPGDVAVVDYGFGEERMMRDHRGWFNATTEISDSEDSVVDARPLIVIDADDREQVERLTNALETHILSSDDYADGVQAALREFANPTPDEPTDPKVRVTDRRENVWRLLADGDWVCTSGPDIGEYLVWWQLAERGPLEVTP